MKSRQVRYIYGPGHNENDLVFTSLGSKFFVSPITQELVDAALKKKVSIIFSQGKFNATPLICAILQHVQRSDILVGLPSIGFKKKSKLYAKDYFSLYSQKVGPQFFYENSIWCNAHFQKTNNSVPKILLDDIKTTPSWGNRTQRKKFADNLLNLVKQGACNEWPRILAIPIKYVFPDKILGNNNFYYEGKKISLAEFSPQFIILEDINERFRGNVSFLEPLIRNLNEAGIGAIFHFSWPYIRGANRLMSNLSDLDSSICKIHMGKRYCIEMQKIFEKNILALDPQSTDMKKFQDQHPVFSRFSVEGNSWESYYSNEKSDNTTKIVLADNRPVTARSLEDLAEIDGPFDPELEEVHSSLSGLQVQPFIKRIFEFPPFMDSFLLPRDIKMQVKEGDSFLWLPLEEAIPIITNSEDRIVRKFTDICRQMNSIMDLRYQIQGQQTPNSVGKYTALTNYLYDLIFSDSLDTNEEIVIATYGKQGALQSKLLERIKLFFEEVSHSNIGEYQSIGNNYQRINTTNFRFQHSILRLETTATPHHNTLELKVNRDDGKYHIELFFISYEQLSNFNSDAIKTKRLLLPGPLPLVYFDGARMIPPRGFDHMVKPYKEINIFVYPGKNSEQLKLQIDSINKLLYGDLSEPIVYKDLFNAIKHNPKKLAVGIPGRPEIKPISEGQEDSEITDSFDHSVREEILESFVQTPSSKNFDLKQTWDNIGHRKVNDEDPSTSVLDTDTEYIQLDVNFITENIKSKVKLNLSSFVNVIKNGSSIQIRAHELSRGDQFAFLDITDKISLADFFIQNFADEQHKDLAHIRSPFDNLFAFIEALEQVKPGILYTDVDFSQLSWLNEEDKESLFNLIAFLKDLEKSSSDKQRIVKQLKALISKSKVWNSLKFLSDEKYDEVFLALKKQFEYTEVREACYSIASFIFELSIAENTFKQRLIRVERGEPNYFFQNEKDMRTIGILIGNKDIEENYGEYNDSGRQVSTVLQQLGLSLGRVIKGEDNPLNEMDAIIRRTVKFCEVL